MKKLRIRTGDLVVILVDERENGCPFNPGETVRVTSYHHLGLEVKRDGVGPKWIFHQRGLALAYFKSSLMKALRDET